MRARVASCIMFRREADVPGSHPCLIASPHRRARVLQAQTQVRSGETRVLDMILNDLKERVLMRFGRSSNKASVMKSSRFKANLSQILNTPDMDGVTPLLIAISCGHFNVTRTLLSLGADAKLRSPSGSTAISIACETNRLDIVNELLQWYQKNCNKMKNQFF